MGSFRVCTEKVSLRRQHVSKDGTEGGWMWVWGKSVPGRCKCWEVGPGLACKGTAREPGWTDMNEGQ